MLPNNTFSRFLSPANHREGQEALVIPQEAQAPAYIIMVNEGSAGNWLLAFNEGVDLNRYQIRIEPGKYFERYNPPRGTLKAFHDDPDNANASRLQIWVDYTTIPGVR